jgi:uncharacterized protein (TIGR03437 family)
MKALQLGLMPILAMGVGFAQAPKITAVVRAADFQPGIPPDDYGTIYGTGLADATYQASTLPWPTKLGSTEVFGCSVYVGFMASACQAFPVFFAAPTQVNFYVPTSALGHYLFVRVNGVTQAGIVGIDYTATQKVQGIPIEPAIFIEGYDCFIDPRYQRAGQPCGLSWTQPPADSSISGPLWCKRGAATNQAGQLLTSGNPAHVGDYITLWMTGIGGFPANDYKALPTTVRVNNAPLYGDPRYNSIGPYPTYASYLGESSVYPGLFQVNVQIPAALQCGDSGWGLPAWPSGNYNWDLLISVVFEGTESNGIWVPLVVHPGDVACPK